MKNDLKIYQSDCINNILFMIVEEEKPNPQIFNEVFLQVLGMEPPKEGLNKTREFSDYFISYVSNNITKHLRLVDERAKSEITNLQWKLSHNQCYFWRSFHDFHSLVLLEKQNKFSEIQVSLITLSVLSSDISIDSNLQHHHSLQLSSEYVKMFIGSISEIQIDFLEYSHYFLWHLQDKINKYRNDKTHVNPKLIINLALSILDNKTFSSENLMENDVGLKLKKYILSLNLSLIFALTENKCLTQTIGFSFKAYVLNQNIKYYENIIQSLQVSKVRSILLCLKKCLQYLKCQTDRINEKYLNIYQTSQILHTMSKKLYSLDLPYKFYKIAYEQQAEYLEEYQVQIPAPFLQCYAKKLAENQKKIRRKNYFTFEIKTMFKNFKQAYQNLQDEESKQRWVTFFQDSIFTIFINQIDTKVPFYNIDPKQISSGLFLQCLQDYCHLIEKREETYGLYLKKASYSHKLLIKLIFAIIAFEVMKRDLSSTIYDLGQYRIPYSLERLYSIFNSLSFKARKAFKKAYNFTQRKKLLFRPIFCHQTNNEGYRNYAEKVFCQQKRMQIYVKNKQKQLEEEKEKMINTIKKWQQKKDYFEINIQYYEKMPCFCSILYSERFEVQTHEFSLIDYEFYQGMRWHSHLQRNPFRRQLNEKCSRCKQLQKYKHLRESHQRQEMLSKITKLPKKTQNRIIYGFCHVVDNRIFRIIQLFLYINSEKNRQVPPHFKLFEKQPVSFISFNSSKETQIPLKSCSYEQIENYISYSSDEVLMLWSSRYPQGLNYYELDRVHAPNLPQGKKFLRGFVDNPNKSLLREHQIYSGMTYALNSGVENYIGLGSLRIGSLTQLPTLLENLTKRTVQISVFQKQHRYIMHLIWLSVSSISSTALLERKDYNQFIRKMIKRFFYEYPKYYTLQDFSSLPILGPVFSFLSKVADEKINEKQQTIMSKTEFVSNCNYPLIQYICQQAEKQYSSLEKDQQLNEQGGQFITQARNYQTFISFSVLCCFTENIITLKNQLAEYFMKFLVIYKAKTIFLQEGNKYHRAIENYSLIKTKAIHSNLRAIKRYFQKKSKALTEIIKIIDENIAKQTLWKPRPEYGEFIFYGKNKKDYYCLNLEDGLVLKNGAQIAGIPEDFKNMEPYIKMFGKQSDYQVFRSYSGKQIRIRKNFSMYFSGNINPIEDSAFFEFEYKVSNEPALSMILVYGKQRKQQKWLFLSEQIKIHEILRAPQFFRRNCYAWYCEERNCIIYRCRSLKQINNVRMVVFLNKNKISHANLIYPQHYTSLQQICDPDSKKFQKFLYTKINQDSSQSLKILKSVEDSSVIYYLESQRKIKKFWLSRSNLTFEQHPGIGIIPSIFKDYRISKYPFNHKYLPWSLADQIACLVLQKIQQSQLNYSMHVVKILIPNFFINEKGVMKIPNDHLTGVDYYIYDLHDSFHDLRGLNRQSQLHLAAILIAINKGIRIPNIYVNGAEYSIKILKSCFQNRPLNEREVKKIKIIFKIAIYHKNLTIILLVVAIILVSSSFFSDTVRLPFKGNDEKQNGLELLKTYKDLIRNAKTQYCLQIQRGQIPFREILPENICQILNLKNSNLQLQKRKNEIPLKIELDKIQVFFKKVEKILNDIKSQKKLISEKKETGIFLTKKNFPIDFEYTKDDILSQQVFLSLKESFEIYLEDEEQRKSPKVIQDKFLNKFHTLKDRTKNLLEDFDKIMNWIRLQNMHHRDCVSQIRPFLSEFDFSNLMKDPNFIYAFYPEIDQKQKEKILKLIQFWMILNVQQESLKRIIFILKSDHIDPVLLLRQCESPRQQIQKKCYWVCFQVEMKIQIWLSQYHTYKTLMNIQKGAATQLNMGEGKTQTIIPMIILEKLYGKQKLVPRINLLSALFEESYSNYIKFLSITSFNIPIFEFPFNRQYPFHKESQKEDRIKLYIGKYLRYFGKQKVFLLDHSSVHSMILKLRELSINKNKLQEFNKEKAIFEGFSCFDIFDQVDAQMNPKKSFVYSVGSSSKLESSRQRYKIYQILLEKFLQLFKYFHQKNFLVYDEPYEEAQRKINNGQFPKGLRISSQINEKNTLGENFRQSIFNKIFASQNMPFQCSFFQQLSRSQKYQIKEYLLNEQKDVRDLPQFISEPVKEKLFAFRGCLACGILEYCLSLRCNVDYGVPDEERKLIKKVAVPYEAAGIPSKKNEYSQPDVSIILSYLSYFNTGLSENQFEECLKKLKKLNLASQMSIYFSWYQILNPNQKQEIQLIPNARAIKINSTAQVHKLFLVFSKNYRCIVFWLTSCVFPSDLIQFTNSITSSSWDHSQVQNSIGFSGTKDNSRLFPPYISLIGSQYKEIKGTDGKMIDLLISNTIDVVDIEKNQNSESIRFIQTALNLSVSCIIDAGALLSGQPLRQIVKWIAKSQRLSDEEFKGITFCDENIWKNYDLNTSEYFVRGTTLQDHETFVIFDEYRTRGSDMKLARNAVAALSLSAFLTKDSLMQALGRLRNLGRNQKLFIVLTQQVKKKIKNMYGFEEKWSRKQKTKAIANWCCMNSINENKKFMGHNIRLAALHLQNRPQSIPYYHQASTSLKFLYSKERKLQTLKNLSEKQLSKFNQIPYYQQTIQKARKNYAKYGDSISVKCDCIDDVCQRQVELLIQVEQQRQDEIHEKVKAESEIQRFQIIDPQQNQHFKFFLFDKKFCISKNFYFCTKNKNQNQLRFNQEKKILKIKSFNIKNINNFFCQCIHFYHQKNASRKQQSYTQMSHAMLEKSLKTTL